MIVFWSISISLQNVVVLNDQNTIRSPLFFKRLKKTIIDLSAQITNNSSVKASSGKFFLNFHLFLFVNFYVINT